MTRPYRLSFERKILVSTLASGAPAIAIAIALLLTTPSEGVHRAEAWTVVAMLAVAWLSWAAHVHGAVSSSMRTAANLVEAIRARDFSVRPARHGEPGAMGELMDEINALAVSLREQRLEAAEASALLQAVLAQVDVALFAFDDGSRLQLVNAAGERLLGTSAGDLLGRHAAGLGAREWLAGQVPRVLDDPLRPGARWELRRATFRRRGLPHVLVVLTDVRRTLRVEERAAWQRLVRVLSHEVNNSLAAVQSIATSQASMLARPQRPLDWEKDLHTGLQVVARRAGSLTRFLASYAKLARLPPPQRKGMGVSPWIHRVVALETRVPVTIEEGPPCTLLGDSDQLDAMLLNLVRNAAEAAMVTGGAARIRWLAGPDQVMVEVEDDGEGLGDSANLFVPFFTTKALGSGIGLVLGRQIAEAHEGELTLENRAGARGCVARVTLPMDATLEEDALALPPLRSQET